jgi:hypothetical protein
VSREKVALASLWQGFHDTVNDTVNRVLGNWYAITREALNDLENLS